MADSIGTRILWQPRSEVRTWRGAILSTATSEILKSGRSVGIIHRADLLAILASEIDPERIRVDYECTAFTPDETGLTLQFANGECALRDLLIGCDGLHSVIRRKLLGPIPPLFRLYGVAGRRRFRAFGFH